MTALHIGHGPVCCAKPGCDLEWPRDPILDVACPDCQAAPGVRCKRPSGHSGSFVEAHASRDLAADAAGAYGTCPLGLCGVAMQPAQGSPLPIGQPRRPAASGQCELF